MSDVQIVIKRNTGGSCGWMLEFPQTKNAQHNVEHSWRPGRDSNSRPRA